MVTLVATAIVIVGLLEWEERRRWKQAENENIRSVVLLSHLIASGWSSPKDINSEDLDPKKARERLEAQSAELKESSRRLDALYERLGTESELVAVVDIAHDIKTLRLYDLEGTRCRRLDYLTSLVNAYLPTLVERRDDPRLVTKFVVLRQAVLAAVAAGRHAGAVIHERVLMDRPEILKPYLDCHPELISSDPVVTLRRATEFIALAYDPERVERILKKEASGHDSLGELSFLPDCLGHVRNEMQWVVKALDLLNDVLSYLEPHLRPSPADVEAELLELRISSPNDNSTTGESIPVAHGRTKS